MLSRPGTLTVAAYSAWKRDETRPFLQENHAHRHFGVVGRDLAVPARVAGQGRRAGAAGGREDLVLGGQKLFV